MSVNTSWGLILALWGAGLGAAAQYGKISVIFDLLPAAYPDAGTALGFVVSLVGFVGIILGVVAGLVVARIGYRRALLWALWTGAAVSFAQALLPPLAGMLALRILEGASHLAIVVAAPTMIARLSAPAHRAFCLTLWGTFFGVAFALLAWLGRPLAINAGLPALFAAHGVYMAGFALLLGARLSALTGVDKPPPLSFRQILRDHGTIYRSPHLAAPAAGWLFYTFSFVSILTVLPPYLAPEMRGLIMGAMPLMSIAVSMTVGVLLLRYMSAVRVVELGFVLSALCMVWLWVAPGAAVACLALAGSMGLIQGASFAAVAQLNVKPADQAQANGAMAQMGNIGNTSGTPIMAAALAGMGYTALPLLAFIAFAAGLAVHLVLGSRRRGAMPAQ
ncbi:MFS transporter [uncultured Sulfitobacter sp.]|uniref:MFS transporter n=1 Tax=uncultured Sulfitobacter sp. TaxID=191468 RepID=UPI002607D644|nr:MFS transporter [uncultured Sulfitobacter sp.]